MKVDVQIDVAPVATGKDTAEIAEAASLSARGWRLARTIADPDGSETVKRLNVARALIFRRTGRMG